MAAAVAIAYHALPPRRTPAVSASAPTWRIPPRVYSPFPARVLRRPMAVPAAADDGSGATGRRRGLIARGRSS